MRLCEVLESGASLLVTRGQLNLCHRTSHAEPQLLVPGEEVDVTVRLDAIGHRFAAGSRLRLSISPCYWPLAWPSPEPVTLTLRHGSGAALVLPERSTGADELELRALDEPQEPEPLASEVLATSNGGFRRIERDLATGATQLIFDWDCGGRSRLANGVEYEDTSVATYSIHDDDPLSANVRVENTSFFGRGDLAGLHLGDRDDDLHRHGVPRDLGARGLRGRDPRVRAHVDARVPARPRLTRVAQIQVRRLKTRKSVSDIAAIRPSA